MRNRRSTRAFVRTISPPARKRLLTAWLFVGTLFLSGAIISYLVFDRQRVLRIDPTDVAQVERGKRIYAEACASCHGSSLEGQPNWQRRMPNGRLPAPPHDASGHTWHHADEWLFRVTKYGAATYPSGYQTDMPAFEHRLKDEEIAASLAFIKSAWPTDIRIKQARMNADPQRRQR